MKMNHSTKITPFIGLSASSMLALGCMADGAGVQDENQEAAQISQAERADEPTTGSQGLSLETAMASPSSTDAEDANAANDENTAEASQALSWVPEYGYYPPGYADGHPPGYPPGYARGFPPGYAGSYPPGWYPGVGNYRYGRYYHPGYGSLPYGYAKMPPGYGFYNPRVGYWRPYYGYWRSDRGWGW
jgi:hypothetical protein